MPVAAQNNLYLRAMSHLPATEYFLVAGIGSSFAFTWVGAVAASIIRLRSETRRRLLLLGTTVPTVALLLVARIWGDHVGSNAQFALVVVGIVFLCAGFVVVSRDAHRYNTPTWWLLPLFAAPGIGLLVYSLQVCASRPSSYWLRYHDQVLGELQMCHPLDGQWTICAFTPTQAFTAFRPYLKLRRFDSVPSGAIDEGALVLAGGDGQPVWLAPKVCVDGDSAWFMPVS